MVHALLKWHEDNSREFPWRSTRSSYHLLLAELMLRRTRALQVAPVYLRLVERYPSPSSLADASPEEVKALLRPLGLQWRIEQFQTMARELVERHAGEVPSNRTELMALTGVADYISDAVLSFGFGEPRAVVDNPIARVISRLFGLAPTGEARRDRTVREIADALVAVSDSARVNFALLDLAAAICTPRNPRHDDCPLALFCASVSDRAATRDS